MRFLCFILFSLLLSKSNAQIIKCSDTKNTPLSKVHLKVFTLDGLLLQDGFTNEKGVLEQVALRSNMLIIKAKHFGYKDYLDTIPLFKDTLKIELFEFSFPLDEIVITAQIGESSRKNSINNESR